MRNHFIDFAAYNQWANDRLYDAVLSLSDDAYRQDRGMFFKSIEGTLNHILLGDRTWLWRLTGEGSHYTNLSEVVYPDFDALRGERQAEDERIRDVLSGYEDGDGEKILSYIDTKGRVWEEKLRIIWGHFFNHQTHHRGQVHNCLSQEGVAPPPLDYIFFHRQKGQ